MPEHHDRVFIASKILSGLLKVLEDWGAEVPPLQLRVLRNACPLASVLPGHRLFVTTGLLDLCGSDDEVAGILAHQIAHWAFDTVVNHGRQSSLTRFGPLCRGVGLPNYE